MLAWRCRGAAVALTLRRPAAPLGAAGARHGPLAPPPLPTLRAVRHVATAPPPPPPATLLAKIVAVSPPTLSAYLRLIRFEKSTGTLLLFFPCLWGTAFAMGATAAATPTSAGVVAALGAVLPPADLVALFLVGSFVMRSAGCIINDMWDQQFDTKVERTKSRPIASGEVSQQQAFLYLTLHLFVGLFVCLSLNNAALGVAVPSVLLLAAYPLAKRFTDLPQLVLGLAFNWGILVGFAAVTGSLSSPVAPLYLAGVLWTLLYDTVYAHQDKKDDVMAGVKSAALYIGDRKLPYFAIAAATCSLLAAAGMMAGYGGGYYGALALASAYLARVVHAVDLQNPASCGLAFARNRYFAALVL
eukprot:EG_transcript_17654